MWDISVDMRGRLGWPEEWWVPRKVLGMFVSGPHLHET